MDSRFGSGVVQPHPAVGLLVQQLYVAYFNRPADPRGMSFWGDIYLQNGDLAAIANEFAQSAEYASMLNGMSHAQIVSQVYLNLFGRAAEPGGLAFWSGLLDQNLMTLANVVTTIAANAKNQDVVTLHDKVLGAMAFTNTLNTTGGIASYNDDMASKIGQSFLDGIVDDATLATQTNPIVLQGWADRLAGQPARSFFLTGGTDLIAPTLGVPLRGHDTINANPIGDGDSLSSGDSIDAGAGVDTLSIVSMLNQALVVPLDVTVRNVENVNLIASAAISVNTAAWGGVRFLDVATQGAATVTAADSTEVNVHGALGTGSALINGGNNLTLDFTGAQSGSTGVSVGSTTAASGSVRLTYDSASTDNGNAVLAVRGGSGIWVSQTHSHGVNTSASNAPVSVVGSANTSYVSIANAAAATASPTVAGVQTANVSVTDVNADSKTLPGKITVVSVSNYTALAINGSAVAVLHLKGGSGNVTISNGGDLATKTLLLSVDDLTGGTLADRDVYTAISLSIDGHDSRMDGISDNALKVLEVSGNNHLTLGSGNNLSALQTVSVKGGAGLSVNLAATALTQFDAGASTGSNDITLDGSRANYIGGGGADRITLTAVGGGHSVKVGSGADSVMQNAAPANLNAYTTILDPHAGLTLAFADKGSETFAATGLTLPDGAVLRDYANAVVAAGGDASINAALGWFQFAGDTYLVESRHNGSTNHAFVDGTDFILKLNGVLDLSHASFATASAILTL